MSEQKDAGSLAVRVEGSASRTVAPEPVWHNRWVRVVVYGLAVSLTSCLFAGWQQFSLILLKGGAYAWECASQNENPEIPGLFTCSRQERLVNSLLPIASGIELAGGVVAGVALDSIGPKLCAIFGSTIGFLSYVMLQYASHQHNMYVPALSISGVAINLIGFPALTLEDHFPDAAATTAAYVIACQCLSSVIPPVLWLLWQHHPGWTYHQLWWGYLLLIWIPVSIPYLALLPLRRAGRNAQIQEDSSKERFSFRVLTRYLGSLPFIVMNCLSVILMLQTSYWQLIVRSELGLKLSEFLGFSMPTQAVWGLMLGRLADFTKTPAIIAILLLMYSFIYGMIPVGNHPVQYFSVIVFNMAMSYAYTIKYSFVQERYPQRYYGTLVGISGALGGCGVLATNILNTIDSPVNSSIGLALVTLPALPLVLWLHWELSRYRATFSRHDTINDLLITTSAAAHDVDDAHIKIHDIKEVVSSDVYTRVEDDEEDCL